MAVFLFTALSGHVEHFDTRDEGVRRFQRDQTFVHGRLPYLVPILIRLPSARWVLTECGKLYREIDVQAAARWFAESGTTVERENRRHFKQGDPPEELVWHLEPPPALIEDIGRSDGSPIAHSSPATEPERQAPVVPRPDQVRAGFRGADHGDDEPLGKSLAWPPTRAYYAHHLHRGLVRFIEMSERSNPALPYLDDAKEPCTFKQLCEAVYGVSQLLEFGQRLKQGHFPDDCESGLRKAETLLLEHLQGIPTIKALNVDARYWNLSFSLDFGNPEFTRTLREILVLVPDPFDCPNAKAKALFEWVSFHLGTPPSNWDFDSPIPAEFWASWSEAFQRDPDVHGWPPFPNEAGRRLIIEYGLLKDKHSIISASHSVVALPTESDVVNIFRRRNSPNKAALVEYMQGRTSATIEDIASQVHGDAETADSTIRKNLSRTNDALIELGVPLRFSIASGRIFKDKHTE